MCGIVGVVFKRDHGFHKKHVDIFTQLLRVNELRGSDATGVVYATNKGDFSVLKEASPSSWATASIMSNTLMKDVIRDGKVLIGHNRAATVGRITDETAHPFVVENTFAMVHNGTLYGHKGLKDTEVDSEALAHHLQPLLEADELVQAAFEEELGKVNGAYAIAAYSQKQHKVFLMRNSQRPLAVIETADAWYWASEGMMLMWVLSRNNESSTGMKILTLKENMLMTFDLEKNTMSETEYVPKKAPAITPITKATTATGVVATASNNTGLSKQEVKRLRRRFLNTRHSFWAEDYIETFYPKTITKGETSLTLMGRLDGVCFPTGYDSCLADVDVKEMLGADWSIKEVMETPMHGIISEIRYTKENGGLVYILRDVQSFTKSVKQQAVQVIEDTRSKWSATSKTPMEWSAEEKANSEKLYFDHATRKWTLPNEETPIVH